jgi:hypothetical protein
MDLKEHAGDIPHEENQVEPSVPDTSDRNRQAAAFISAGRAAVERALSNDSRRFLSQNQQKGGQ